MPDPFGRSLYVWPKCQCEIDAYEERKRQEDETEAQRKIDQQYGVFGFPDRFKSRLIETFRPDQGSQTAFGITKSYIETLPQRVAEGAGIWYTGTAGNGKTHLAASVYHAAREAKYTVVFTCVADMLAKIKDSYSPNSPYDEWQLMGPLHSAKILILDDLGKEKATEWAREKLFSIVNQRYEGRRSIIITSNYDPDAIAERIGEATMDRLTGMCRYVEVKSDSRRLNEVPTW